MKKPPPIFAFSTYEAEDQIPLEGAVLATEIATILPRTYRVRGEIGSLILPTERWEPRSNIVLRSGARFDAFEDAETLIRRWVDTLVKYEAEEVATWGIEGR